MDISLTLSKVGAWCVLALIVLSWWPMPFPVTWVWAAAVLLIALSRPRKSDTIFIVACLIFWMLILKGYPLGSQIFKVPVLVWLGMLTALWGVVVSLATVVWLRFEKTREAE